MVKPTLTPERFETLRQELGWDEDRAWVLGSRLVDGHPYSALAELTGRTVEALRKEVERAWKQIGDLEERQRQSDEDYQDWLRDEQRYAGLIGKALLLWDAEGHHFPLWACILALRSEARYYTPYLTPVERVEMMMDLVRWRDQRMTQYLAGEAPAPW
jgi:hypothetical protein